jgi:hypothetical protein
LTAGIIAGSVAPATTATAVFAELAALYVIARGLDIIHQSLTGTVKEAWEHVFFARSPRS